MLDLDTFPTVAQGEAAPLVKPLVTAAHVHGDDGLGNTSHLQNADGTPLYPPANTDLSSMSGVDLILETAAHYPDELIVVALGPPDEYRKSNPQRTLPRCNGYRKLL